MNNAHLHITYNKIFCLLVTSITTRRKKNSSHSISYLLLLNSFFFFSSFVCFRSVFFLIIELFIHLKVNNVYLYLWNYDYQDEMNVLMYRNVD